MKHKILSIMLIMVLAIVLGVFMGCEGEEETTNANAANTGNGNNGDEGCTNEDDCLTGYECKNNECVEKSTGNTGNGTPSNTVNGDEGCTTEDDCLTGHVCENGQCVQDSTDDVNNNTNPNTNTNPDNNTLVDPCEDITCATGQECVEGNCVDVDACADVICEQGQQCNPATGDCEGGVTAETKVGDECVTQTDCDPGVGYCIGATFTDDDGTHDTGFVGGQCVNVGCNPDPNDCPMGSSCYSLFGADQNGNPVYTCHRDCNVNASEPKCPRTEYTCMPTSGNLGICFPHCNNLEGNEFCDPDEEYNGMATCNLESGLCDYDTSDITVGAACTTEDFDSLRSDDCGTFGRCYPGMYPNDQTNELEETGWSGGYCTEFSCDANANDCPGAEEGLSMCVPLFSDGGTMCLSKCATPDAALGENGCREGYGCMQITQNAADGGVCLPACASDEDCGEGYTCNTTSGNCEAAQPTQ